jgi:aryl-alcohol dehydrogenase
VKATAAVLHENGAPFQIEDIELEEPRPDEVLVRVAAVGVCGTDIEFANFFATPAVLGHEGAGIVERVGSAVTRLQPGDHVAMTFASCGACDMCLTAAPAYCRSFDAINFGGGRLDGSSPITQGGATVKGNFLGQSSFASHVVANQSAVVAVDASLDLTKIGPFGCGFQTGAGGVFNVLKPAPGSSIAIFGAGAVGVAALIAANLSGCREIVAVDVNPDKLATALKLGATHAVNSADEDAADALRAIKPGGFEFVIDTTGRADVLRTGVEALAPFGRAGVIGIGPSPDMSFEWRSVLNGRSITGIIAGSSIPQLFLPRLMDLFQRGDFPVDTIMTSFGFDQINEAVAAVKSGAVGKAVLTF